MKVMEEFGRTVDEARQKAFAALGLPEDVDQRDVKVEVLDPGSPGDASGWAKKFARVKVTVLNDELLDEDDDLDDEDEDDLDEDEDDLDDEDEDDLDDEDEDDLDDEDEDDLDDEDEDDLDDEDEDDLDDEDEAPADILEDILDLMHLHASVEEDEIDGQLHLNIVGPDLGVLIGKHGQTLDALQFVLNLIVNQKAAERTRITIDVGGYRARRERTLRELAHRMARRALDEQGPVSLEPMSAAERRIIHLALADDTAVETYSQGEEPMRKVIVIPRR
jgi:spoIIIJ-associated protein